MAYDFITRQELETRLEQERRFYLAELKERDQKIQDLQESSPDWLTTKQACKFLRISRPTFQKERDALGSLIVMSCEGEKGGTKLYDRQSLIAYKESKTIRRLVHPSLAA